MALPPMRPRTTRNGTPCGSAASAALDSAAPTKPTGTPMIAAGFGAPPASNSIRGNKGAGPLPPPPRAPPPPLGPQPRGRGRGGGGEPLGEFRHARIAQRADDLVAGR